jgi:hypothetical protein
MRTERHQVRFPNASDAAMQMPVMGHAAVETNPVPCPLYCQDQTHPPDLSAYVRWTPRNRSRVPTGITTASKRVLPARHDRQNTCCFPETCQVLRRKINIFAKSRNTLTFPPIPRSLRRAFRDRHDALRGERWTRSCSKACGAIAYGEAAWSCPPDAGDKRMKIAISALRPKRRHSRQRLTSPDSGESAE